MHSYSFQDVARSERYFVSSLLCHVLMNNNFEGLQSLFKRILGNETCDSLKLEFEIVSELDPLRDGSVYHNEVKKLYKEFKRIAVPDLFLRWDNQCLIIEAKFFTDPDDGELYEQIRTQMSAIEKVKEFTNYQHMHFYYVALTVNGIQNNEVLSITWSDVLDIIDILDNKSHDMFYCSHVIKKAVERVRLENKPGGNKVTFEKHTLESLILNLPDFIKKGKIYVGFSGGLDALNQTDLVLLEKRSHYKVSDIRWSDNWITIDNIVRRYIELKDYTKVINSDE